MNFDQAYAMYVHKWVEPHRFYHTTKHLDRILNQCQTNEERYFALFHDIVYIPGYENNEQESADFFRQECHKFEDLNDPDLVYDMILATKDHPAQYDPRIQTVLDLDMAILDSDFDRLMEYEHQIFKEFQKTDIDSYIYGRVDFLLKYQIRNINIPFLIDYVRDRQYKIGIYPGSFNPMHLGHENIIQKAEQIFDKVIVVQAQNAAKEKNSYPLPNIIQETVTHEGLLSNYPKSERRNVSYSIIRGVRNTHDVQEEINFVEWMGELGGFNSFVHIFCDQEYAKLSSSTLRQLDSIGVDISEWRV